MGMFLKLVQVLKVAPPLPNWENEEEVAGWWEGMGPSMAGLIATIVTQARTRGELAVALPMNGPVLTFGGIAPGDPYMIDDVEELARALETAPELTGKFGDGKILEFLTKLWPLIMQILPFFLKKDPSPTPDPPPVV